MKFMTIVAGVFLLAGGAIGQQQSGPKPDGRPRQNRSLDGTPLDPFKESARVREKETVAKDYKDMKEAASELAELSQRLNEDVAESGTDVISARIIDRAEKIEKLARRIRDKARSY